MAKMTKSALMTKHDVAKKAYGRAVSLDQGTAAANRAWNAYERAETAFQREVAKDF